MLFSAFPALLCTILHLKFFLFPLGFSLELPVLPLAFSSSYFSFTSFLTSSKEIVAIITVCLSLSLVLLLLLLFIDCLSFSWAL